MKQMLTAVGVCGAIALGTFVLQAQGGAPQTPAPSQPPARPAPSADPYATNAVPGATTFPLAAAAGVDSKARETAPAGAANQGASMPRRGSSAQPRRRRPARSSGIPPRSSC